MGSSSKAATVVVMEANKACLSPPPRSYNGLKNWPCQAWIGAVENEVHEDFCENISTLWSSRQVTKLRKAFKNLLADEMTINLYMFSLFMENRISSNMLSRLVITIELYWSEIANSKLIKEPY